MKIATTATNALMLLWEDKVFLKPKDLKTIELELSKRGYNFTDKNLMMALMRAVFLTRKGQKGNYSYVQKHPFVQETKDADKQTRR